MFTSRGRLLGGGSVREAHTPDIQESPEGCKFLAVSIIFLCSIGLSYFLKFLTFLLS